MREVSWNLFLILILSPLLFAPTISLRTFQTSDSSHEENKKCEYFESITYDDRGIPNYDYGTVNGTYIGLQRSPITIANEALKFYDQYQESSKSPRNETAREFFINNADWLLNNVATKDKNTSQTYAIFEYNFPWPYYNLTSPWRDAMTQGRALEVMTKAHSLTGEQKYLDTAKMLLNSFYKEVKDGGVTYKTAADGWWYEHYADQGAVQSRVLNGMMFTLLGIYQYYNHTHDTNAKYLFDQGIASLKNELPRYDNNSNSFYDSLGRPAGTFYTPIHLRLLAQLYDLTGEPLFKEYFDMWGRNFVLTYYKAGKVDNEYIDECIDSEGLFRINIDTESANHITNLLDNEAFVWKSVNDAHVLQRNNELDLIVDTESTQRLYNRAYLQTDTHVGYLREGPLFLTLDYMAQSFEGNATFVLDIMSEANNTSLFSLPLLPSNQTLPDKLMTEKFILPERVSSEPLEFRLYAITEKPGFHVMLVKNASLIWNPHVEISPVL